MTVPLGEVAGSLHILPGAGPDPIAQGAQCSASSVATCARLGCWDRKASSTALPAWVLSGHGPPGCLQELTQVWDGSGGTGLGVPSSIPHSWALLCMSCHLPPPSCG